MRNLFLILAITIFGNFAWAGCNPCICQPEEFPECSKKVYILETK